jgi:hypothetical protein
MMRIKVKDSALYELRRLPKVVDAVERISETIADQANGNVEGEGYKTGSRQGLRKPYGRWRASVVTADAESMADNGKNNTLVRLLNSARF